MRQSNFVTKTKKERTDGGIARNADILIRSGYIHKTMSGVYSLLPLGLISVNKIINIIREEMNKIGSQEVFLNGLQDPEVWKQTDRWSGDAEEVWFKSKLQSGGDVGFGWTHEEPITEMMKHHINSYRDLPLSLYQFQTKYRNEKRAKSGILRTREFIMKDLYSFSKNKEEHKQFYEKCSNAYSNIFKRIGIADITYKTLASGGAFSEFSEEFQTESEYGEDVIYYDKKTGLSINEEILNDDTLKKLNLNKDDLEKKMVVEVGNIFTLGTRFSKPLGLKYTCIDGKQQFVFMGSYGIGPARLLGVLVDINSDNNSVVLPRNVTPYSVHIIQIGDSDNVRKKSEEVYEKLNNDGYSVLYDDRDLAAGEKLGDSDLIGIPDRIIVSEKTLENDKVEYLNRINKGEKMIDFNLKELTKNL